MHLYIQAYSYTHLCMDGVLLAYPSYGLAYLLQHFASVTTDKKYQLADWRIRSVLRDSVCVAISSHIHTCSEGHTHTHMQTQHRTCAQPPFRCSKCWIRGAVPAMGRLADAVGAGVKAAS
jgi:hypothetical protein